jgi:hypothetical protein
MVVLGKMKDATATIRSGSSMATGVASGRDATAPGGRESGSSLLRFILGLNSGILCAAAVLALGNLPATAQVSREYQLKAVFLFNFAQFTDWPDSAFANDKSPIIIGIVGPDPFGPALEATLRDESIKGRPLVLEHYSQVSDIKTCHILFVTQSDVRHMGEILNSVKEKPVLTVADSDSAASAGAIIRFSLQNNKVRFRINAEAARVANISLSSKLLRVADASPAGGSAP